jgi:hypothetical protein
MVADQSGAELREELRLVEEELAELRDGVAQVRRRLGERADAAQPRPRPAGPLDAALGPVTAVRGHGDPAGWLGLMLDHQVSRFSEASLYAAGETGTYRAEVEVFGGPGGSATVDCAAAVGPETFAAMVGEFAAAVERGTPNELDVQHGLRLQRVLEAAETDLIVGA